MKKLLILFLLLCSASVVRAQDVIVKKDGSTVVCRVVELNATEIVYKKWGDLNGSNYIMDRSLASVINYENGRKDVLGEVQNQYQPGNQNDGVQQYNDRALLNLNAINTHIKAQKRLKNIGWIGGGLLAGVGVTMIAASSSKTSPTVQRQVSCGCIGAGAIWTTGFLLAANYEKSKAEKLQSSSIYHYEINLFGESSLSAGLDLLKDNMNHSQTLGLGLRYNF